MTTPRQPNKSVTREEFESHQRHVDQRFNTLTASMADGFGSMHSQIAQLVHKIDSATAPRYNLILSAAAIGLTLVSFCAAIVWMMTNHTNELSKARDDVQQVRLDQFMEGGNRWTIDDQKEYGQRIESAIADLQNQVESLKIGESERSTLRQQIAGLQDQFDHHASLADHPLGVIAMIENIKARVAILEGKQGKADLD